MSKNSVIRKGLSFSRDLIEVGYIICPPNEVMSRNDYVSYCYRTNTVSVLTDTFGYINNVFVEKEIMKEIIFPEEVLDENIDVPYGSAVLILYEKINNRAFIVGVYQIDQEIESLKENLFLIQRFTSNNEVSIVGDGNNGEIIIKTKSKDSNNGGINISVINNNRNAKFNLDVQGNINIRCENNININALNQIILNVLNQTTEQETKLSFKDQEIKINEGTDVAVLGNKLVAELNKTNTYLQTMKAALDVSFTSLDAVVPGISAEFKKAMIGQSLGNYSQVLSQIFKIE
jgi:hypothetical protein